MKIRSPPHPTSAQMWAQLWTFQNLKNEKCKTIIRFSLESILPLISIPGKSGPQKPFSVHFPATD